jgi:transposase
MDCRPIRRGGHVYDNDGTGSAGGGCGVPRVAAATRRQGPSRFGRFWKRCIITWRALPKRFGKWNGVWKRFERLSKAAVFEMFFDRLASVSSSAQLVQMFGSTVVRAHVSPIFHSAIYEQVAERELQSAPRTSLSVR